MYKIIVENKCSCFKKSGLENNLSFDSKDMALIKALRLKDKMNQEFCRKHDFQVMEKNENFIICFDKSQKEFVCCGKGCCG